MNASCHAFAGTEENLLRHSKRLSGVYVMPDAQHQHREITLK